LNENLPSVPELEILPGAKFLMAQAIALPMKLVDDHNQFMLAWTTENHKPYGTDTATAQWLKARSFRFARAWPSLVDHASVASLYGHNSNPNRKSPSYQEVYGR